MPDDPVTLPSQPYRAAAIIGKKPLHFTYVPDAGARAAIAAHLGLQELRALRLKGALSPKGRGDVVLTAEFQADIVQSCTVTLAPVHTQISSQMARDYLRDYAENAALEVELGPDDTDAIPEFFDIAAIAIEELSLCLPLYPRAPGAELGAVQAAPAGAAPLSDDKLRPFAALAGLAAAMTTRATASSDQAEVAQDTQNKDEKPN